jgi:hypothetical protein
MKKDCHTLGLVMKAPASMEADESVSAVVISHGRSLFNVKPVVPVPRQMHGVVCSEGIPDLLSQDKGDILFG